MPKTYLFVKQHESDTPPEGMREITRKMTPDDIMVIIDQTEERLRPRAFSWDGPMEVILTFEDDHTE